MLIKVILAYIVIVAIIYFFQRSLYYFPTRDMELPQNYGLDMEVLTLTTSDNIKISAWYYKSKEEMPVIVFFHGNAGHLGYRSTKFQDFINEGFGVLAISYRGYGTSEGSPTEKGLYEDAKAGLQYLHDSGIKNSEIILFGESLGSGVAIELASIYPDISALALEAPFTSAVDRGAEIYWWVPVRLLMKDRYESLKKIVSIKTPLLVFYSEEDEIIPAYHSKSLFEASPSKYKKLVQFENTGHNYFDSKREAREIRSWRLEVESLSK